MSGLRASRGLTLIPLLFMLAVSSACSERITSAAEQETAVQLRVPFDAAGPTIQASRFVLTVTGPGIEAPIVSELAYEGGLLTGSVVVPAGPKRLFRVDAYDRTETLVYSGKALSDVKPGSEVVLDIDLRPQVPMIQVVPMYVETLQGDLLALTIRVYRLPDVSRIDVRIVDHRLMGNTYIVPDNVVIDPQTAKVAGSTVWTAGDYSTNISLTLRNASDRLVDETEARPSRSSITRLTSTRCLPSRRPPSFRR